MTGNADARAEDRRGCDAIKLFAPALLISEVCNTFCKRVRRGAMSAPAANEAHELLKLYSPVLVDDRDLMDEAMTLALTTGQALYDCLYLALAQTAKLQPDHRR